MNLPLIFENDGPILSRTNYFDSEYAKEGNFYLSWNAGTARLLVPDSMKSHLHEMKNTKYVIITRGNWTEVGKKNAIELLFEDHSDEPYCIFLSPEQSDRLIPKSDQGSSDNFFISVYVRMGEKFRFPAKYRIVEEIPYLKAWEEKL